MNAKTHPFDGIKRKFPIFTKHPGLVYLDSAASAQKPKCVIEALKNGYGEKYANIHRGLYALSLESTRLYEEARTKTARFFGAEADEIIFTKNGTEASNLFAHSFSEAYLEPDDEVLITLADHHANILPWLHLQKKRSFTVRFIEPDKKGVFALEHFQNAISKNTKLMVLPHVSNTTGAIFPVREIVKIASAAGAKTMLDICQSAPHLPVDLKSLGVDAAFFTGHKLGAPGGTGGLFVKKELMKSLPPFLVGGDMIETASVCGFTTREAPQKFEAGTPAIMESIALGAALDFLGGLGMENVRIHEKNLVEYALGRIRQELPRFSFFGPEAVDVRSGIISLTHSEIHPNDLAQHLATKNIAVRSGYHCSEPIHTFLGLKTGSLRMSFWVYTERQDIDAFVSALKKAESLFLG